MSGAEAPGHQIEISCVRVPDTLLGLSLPCEIVSPEGTVQRALLAVGDGARTKVEVAEPGRYLIRVELPAGDWLVGSATVPDDAAAGSEGGSRRVVLDFGATALRESLPRRRPARGRGFTTRRSFEDQEAQSYKQRPPLGDFALALPGLPPPEEAGLSDFAAVYGTFGGWKVSAGNTLILDKEGEGSVEPSGDFHRPARGETAQWRPLLVRVSLLLGGRLPPGDQALVIWLPSPAGEPLRLSPPPSPSINKDAPLLLARSASGDRLADALYAYVRAGRIDMARQMMPAFVTQAEGYLTDEDVDPVRAILGAYVLQMVGGPEHPDSLKNLADRFRYLPDGALLYGWYLLRAGRAPEAKPFFRAAVARGVPLHFEGVRLQLDGLRFLSALEPEDAELKADTARAFRLAAAGNPSSELTCLRLGENLAVEVA